jgi:hypothetical protein
MVEHFCSGSNPLITIEDSLEAGEVRNKDVRHYSWLSHLKMNDMLQHYRKCSE